MPASLHLIPRPSAGGAVARRCARAARPVASAAASSPAPAGPPPVDPSVRTAMITGANTGIGYETAKSLAQQGYHVVLACRDKSKAEAARERLRCMHVWRLLAEKLRSCGACLHARPRLPSVIHRTAMR